MKAVYVMAQHQISFLGNGTGCLSGTTAPQIDSGICAAPHRRPADLICRCVAGEPQSVPASEIRQMDMLTQTTVACAESVLAAVDGVSTTYDPEQRGIIIGSAFGCSDSNHNFLDTLLQKGARFVKPVVFRNTVSNAVAGHIAVNFDFKGPNSVLNNGMVSGPQALAYAFEEIRGGRCGVVLTGAGDCSSKLIARRYQRQLRNSTRGPWLPLMDGACLMLLTDGKTAKKDDRQWAMTGYSMGFMNRRDIAAQVVDLLARALDAAAMDFNALDALIVQGDRTYSWVKGDRVSGLTGLGEFAAAAAAVTAENTALPAMLTLTEALSLLPRLRRPRLFAGAERPRDVKRAPETLAFISFGYHGDMAALVFGYAY